MVNEWLTPVPFTEARSGALIDANALRELLKTPIRDQLWIIPECSRWRPQRIWDDLQATALLDEHGPNRSPVRHSAFATCGW